MDRSAARAARRAVALPAGGRREADARRRCEPAGSPSGASSRRSPTTTRLDSRLRGDPRAAPACPPGRGSPRQRIDRRPALAVRRALAPSHVPVRRADRRLRARHLRRRRSGAQPVRVARRPRGAAVALGRRLRRGRSGRDASGLPARGPLRPADAAPVPRCGAVRAPLRPRGVPRRAASGMYARDGLRGARERIVEPKPGWRFRSHLLYADAERLLRDEPASGTVAAMASAIAFAGLRSRPERADELDLASQLAAAAARRDVTTFRPILLDARSPDTPAALAALAADRRRGRRRAGASSSSSSSGAARPASALAASAARRRSQASWTAASRRLRHVGVLSVEPPAGARPARAAAPRAAPGPQPLRDHRRRSRSGWPAVRRRRGPVGRARGRVRRWRTRASAASCGSPTSTCSTSRTSTAWPGGVADVGVSKVVLAAREVAELDPYIRVVAFPRGVAGGDDRRVRRRAPTWSSTSATTWR